jgi:hypothetical protein
LPYGGSPQLARAWGRPLSTYASVCEPRSLRHDSLIHVAPHGDQKFPRQRGDPNAPLPRSAGGKAALISLRQRTVGLPAQPAHASCTITHVRIARPRNPALRRPALIQRRHQPGERAELPPIPDLAPPKNLRRQDKRITPSLDNPNLSKTSANSPIDVQESPKKDD